MNALSAAQAAPSSTTSLVPRTWRHMLSQRIARLSGKQIGEVCNCDHTQASRIASGQRGATLDEWCALIEAVGLKLVDKDKLCVSRDQHEFMRRVTARVIANEEMSQRLFEDPE